MATNYDQSAIRLGIATLIQMDWRPGYTLSCCVLVALWAAGAVGKTGDAAQTSWECALPVIVRAGLEDIRESWFNGPEGYAFFSEADSEKTGNLPLSVGEDPIRRFDTAVYASNFQGPVLVRHSGLRPQWEWTASGELQISDREYPLLVARRCAERGKVLPAVTLHVEEDDEPPWRNDHVGAFRLELEACRDVLSETRPAGWSQKLRSDGWPHDEDRGARDAIFVEYVLWCYRCERNSDCERGIVWPSSPGESDTPEEHLHTTQ
jgi:hypothetical protein